MQILTQREIRLLSFVVLAALLGMAVQAWRSHEGVAPLVAAPAQEAE